MNVQITVRNVPSSVRDELAARAARQGQSMQEFIRKELERIAAQPTTEMLLERVRDRKAKAATLLTVDEVIDARDADRS